MQINNEKNLACASESKNCCVSSPAPPSPLLFEIGGGGGLGLLLHGGDLDSRAAPADEIGGLRLILLLHG